MPRNESTATLAPSNMILPLRIIALSVCHLARGRLEGTLTNFQIYASKSSALQVREKVRLPVEAIIVLLHHYIGIPTEVFDLMRRRQSALEIRALALRDALELTSILSDLSKCIVFHP